MKKRRGNLGLEEQSVLMMIVLSVLTWGVYPAYWFLVRVEPFNRIAKKKSLHLKTGTIVLVTALCVLYALASLLAFLLRLGGIPQGNAVLESAKTILGLFAGLGRIVLSFKVRAILNLKIKTGLPILFTFLFGPFYLQFRINELLAKMNHLKGRR